MGFQARPHHAELLRRLSAIAAFAIDGAGRSRIGASMASLSGRPAAADRLAGSVAGVDHDVVIDGDDVTVDGEPLVMALDYTPGDRIMEAEFGRGR